MKLTGFQERALELLTRPKVMGKQSLADAQALAMAVDIFDRLYRRTGGGPAPAPEAIAAYLARAGHDGAAAHEVALVWRAVNLVRDFEAGTVERPFHHLNLSPKP